MINITSDRFKFLLPFGEDFYFDYQICPAEPDVGIMKPYAEILEIITSPSGHCILEQFTTDNILEMEKYIYEEYSAKNSAD